MGEKTDDLANHMRQLIAGPMSPEEVEFLRDVQGMIDFAIRNGVHFAVVVSAILHDLVEIRQEGGDLKKAKARGFHPKVSGYAKITSESFGGENEPLE